MARSKTPAPETITQRIDFLLGFGRGTMPIGLPLKTEAEAAEARKILKSRGKKAEALIIVTVNNR